MGARKQEDKNRELRKWLGVFVLKGVGVKEDKTGKEKGCERMRRNDRF